MDNNYVILDCGKVAAFTSNSETAKEIALFLDCNGGVSEIYTAAEWEEKQLYNCELGFSSRW